MSTPLSFCDISARYGQTPAPQQTLAEQTGWNSKQLFLQYMLKVREKNRQSAKEAEEDALMAMIDAMNASEEDRKDMAKSLADAGKAITAQHETVLEDGTKRIEYFDPTQALTIQVLLACLGGRFNFEQADQIQEKAREDREQEAKEERLEVTEQREPGSTGDPNNIERR